MTSEDTKKYGGYGLDFLLGINKVSVGEMSREVMVDVYRGIQLAIFEIHTEGTKEEKENIPVLESKRTLLSVTHDEIVEIQKNVAKIIYR